MREFTEPMSYAFKDVTSLYTPAYDETYRTKGTETHSTSFFCWSTKNDPGDYSPPLTFSHLMDEMNSDDATGPLFPSMSDEIGDPVTSPQLDDGTIHGDGYSEMTSEMIFDYSAFDCMLMKEEGEVRIKQEPVCEPPQSQLHLNYADPSMMNLFPSFQEEFKSLSSDDQQTPDPFQLFGRQLNQETTSTNEDTSTNLQNIIDECISLESSFNSPERLFDEELSEISSCRWLGCQASFPSQDQLVSLMCNCLKFEN